MTSLEQDDSNRLGSDAAPFRGSSVIGGWTTRAGFFMDGMEEGRATQAQAPPEGKEMAPSSLNRRSPARQARSQMGGVLPSNGHATPALRPKRKLRSAPRRTS